MLQRVLPAERVAVFHRGARIMADRHDEIVDWLVREAGSAARRAASTASPSAWSP